MININIRAPVYGGGPGRRSELEGVRMKRKETNRVAGWTEIGVPHRCIIFAPQQSESPISKSPQPKSPRINQPWEACAAIAVGEFGYQCTFVRALLVHLISSTLLRIKASPEHYAEFSRQQSNIVQEAPMADQQASYNTCRPWTTLCLYTDSEGQECFEPIDCSTVPDHFRDSHGITNMGREVELVCITSSVTYVSITFDTIGRLVMQTNLSYALEDDLFNRYGRSGRMTAIHPKALAWVAFVA
ncbi:hypothetical protein BKA82DRAFT_4017159 [Pisolithus tinctorius]|nr:hypothetical protein BKA82DRAFT_4017159 [Pisolithus tinctorius]